MAATPASLAAAATATANAVILGLELQLLDPRDSRRGKTSGKNQFSANILGLRGMDPLWLAVERCPGRAIPALTVAWCGCTGPAPAPVGSVDCIITGSNGR